MGSFQIILDDFAKCNYTRSVTHCRIIYYYLPLLLFNIYIYRNIIIIIYFHIVKTLDN